MRRVLDNIHDVRSETKDQYTKGKVRTDADEEAEQTAGDGGVNARNSDSDDEFDLKAPESVATDKKKSSQPSHEEMQAMFDALANTDLSEPAGSARNCAFEDTVTRTIKADGEDASNLPPTERIRQLSRGIQAMPRVNFPASLVRETLKDKWENDVKSYARPAQGPAASPPTAATATQQPPMDSVTSGTSTPLVAGVIVEEAEHMNDRVPPNQMPHPWTEPEWISPTPGTAAPSIAEAAHKWRLNFLQSFAFHLMANSFLQKPRGSHNEPRGPAELSTDNQLLMILNGEAGTGKSQVIKCFMWFVQQHGLADEVVATSFQGRPVANLRNPAVRCVTSSMLFNVNSRAGNTITRNNHSVNRMQRDFQFLASVIQDESFLTCAEHFDACNRQSSVALASRAAPAAPFGGLDVILAGDVLQHKPVKGLPLFFGASTSRIQHLANVRMSPHAKNRAAAGGAVYDQFEKVSSLTYAHRRYSSMHSCNAIIMRRRPTERPNERYGSVTAFSMTLHQFMLNSPFADARLRSSCWKSKCDKTECPEPLPSTRSLATSERDASRTGTWRSSTTRPLDRVRRKPRPG